MCLQVTLKFLWEKKQTYICVCVCICNHQCQYVYLYVTDIYYLSVKQIISNWRSRLKACGDTLSFSIGWNIFQLKKLGGKCSYLLHFPKWLHLKKNKTSYKNTVSIETNVQKMLFTQTLKVTVWWRPRLDGKSFLLTTLRCCLHRIPDNSCETSLRNTDYVSLISWSQLPCNFNFWL